MKKQFKSTNNGWAASAGDVEVGLASTNGGPSGLQAYYSKGGKTLSLFAESGGDPMGKDYRHYVYLPKGKWQWDSPHENEEISETEKKQILEAFNDGFSVMDAGKLEFEK